VASAWQFVPLKEAAYVHVKSVAAEPVAVQTPSLMHGFFGSQLAVRISHRFSP
jgi:hypothetical protein